MQIKPGAFFEMWASRPTRHCERSKQSMGDARGGS
jgi:hypothetical protein